MFCVHCGAKMEPEQRVCPACGQQIANLPAQAGAAQGASPEDTRVVRHLSILGVLWVARGVLKVLGAGWSYVVGTRLLPWLATEFHFPMEGFFTGFLPGMILFGTWFQLVVAAVCAATGFGLLQKEPWARPLALVMGVLALFSVPFGTALGIYTLWVLLPTRSEAEYRRLVRTA